MRCRQDTKCPSQCLGLWMKGPCPINREKNPAVATGCPLLEAGTAVFSSSIPSPAPKTGRLHSAHKPNVAWRFHGTERYRRPVSGSGSSCMSRVKVAALFTPTLQQVHGD